MRLLVVALLLTGCTAIPNRSTAQLCHELMTLPSYNIWHQARWSELQKRGQTCGDSATVAAGQRQADQNALQTLQTLQSMQPPPPPRPVTCTTSYVGNQAYTTCR